MDFPGTNCTMSIWNWNSGIVEEWWAGKKFHLSPWTCFRVSWTFDFVRCWTKFSM